MANKNTYIILTILMMFWGFNVSATKVLVDEFMPITITSLRVFTAGITALIILIILRIFRLPQKKEWLYILGGTALNVVLHHYFLASGLTNTSATNAGLILGMGPLLTVILSMIILRQRPTFLRLFGFILGAIGVSVTVVAGSTGIESINLGDIQVLISILSQALSFILIKKASATMDARLLTGYMIFFGSIILFIISLSKEPGGLASLTGSSLPIWLVFLFSAVIATGIGHILYNNAVAKIGPAESSIFLNLNTFFSLLGAVLFLNETLLPAHFFGLLFIVSGVLLGSGGLEAWLIQRRRARHSYRA